MFISILISLLLYDEMNLGKLFSSKDKDPRLKLMTISFKCYFRGCFSSKTVCCCGTTQRRKGLKSLSALPK